VLTSIATFIALCGLGFIAFGAAQVAEADELGGRWALARGGVLLVVAAGLFHAHLLAVDAHPSVMRAVSAQAVAAYLLASLMVVRFGSQEPLEEGAIWRDARPREAGPSLRRINEVRRERRIRS
jgi:hypothetical protein